jgi:hypothetical protein
MAAELLDKYIENQRADNEDLFAKWDKLVEIAKSLKIKSTSIRMLRKSLISIVLRF